MNMKPKLEPFPLATAERRHPYWIVGTLNVCFQVEMELSPESEMVTESSFGL
jgi:hypothetical protein